MNKLFIKDKNIEGNKNLQPQTLEKFSELVKKVSFREEWADKEIKSFSKVLEDTYRSQKERIIVDSLKDFDRSIKKQIESLVSNAFYDKKIFCDNFWGHINQSYK